MTAGPDQSVKLAYAIKDQSHLITESWLGLARNLGIVFISLAQYIRIGIKQFWHEQIQL